MDLCRGVQFGIVSFVSLTRLRSAENRRIRERVSSRGALAGRQPSTGSMKGR